MDHPTLRYFCQVTGAAHESCGTWGDLGFAYFRALKDAGLSVRVLATMGVADVGDEENRWHPFAADFATELPAIYVNVVCADNGELVRLYTIGVQNVAITGIRLQLPTKKELQVLGDYDAVLTPTREAADALKRLGLAAQHVAPQADALKQAFASL